MRRTLLLGLCAAVLLGTSPAAGAAQVRDTVVTLDSMSVRVTRGDARLARVPAAVAVVGGDELRSARAGIGLDEALGVVPGLYVSNRHNFSLGPRVTIRGLGSRTAFGVRGVRVIADGIPLTLPDGQTNLGNLDLLSAGTIEVLRGPASALWGNAAGGVILVRTGVPAQEGTGAEARVVVSDLGSGTDDPANLRRYSVRLGGRSGRVGWIASGSHLDQRGYRAHSTARVTQFNGIARVATDADGELTVLLNAVDSPEAENPGSLPADSAQQRPSAAWPNNVRTGSGESTRQVQAGISWADGLGRGRFEAGAWGLTRDVDNPLPFGYITVDRVAAGARAAWSGSLGESLELTTGIDLEHQRDERTERSNEAGAPGAELRRDQVDRVTTLAPFVQGRVRLGDRAGLTAGARYDRFAFAVDDAFLGDGTDDSGDRDLSAASGFLGATLDVSPGWTLWANAGTAFQTPTTTELINRPPVPGSPCCPGGFDPELEPQTARSAEAGVRHGTARLSLDLSAFAMNVGDAIVPFQVPDVDARTFYRNAGETRHRGIEAGLTLATAGATARAAYTWTRVTFEDDGDATTDFEDNDVPGAPEHRFVLRLARPFGPFRAEADLDHTGAYWADDANTARNDAATVVGLRLEATLAAGRGRVRPFVALLNATDTRYNGSVVVNAFGGRYYEPSPGRSLMLGLTIDTGYGW